MKKHEYKFNSTRMKYIRNINLPTRDMACDTSTLKSVSDELQVFLTFLFFPRIFRYVL